MDGWIEQISKTHGKKFYYHSLTGRRQWYAPNKDIENDKEKIRLFYELNDIGEHLFLKVIKSSIFYEFTMDLKNDWYHDQNPFSVLDVGCGRYALDYKLWDELQCTRYVGIDAKIEDISTTTKVCIKGDFTGDILWTKLGDEKFDVISCMFSAQYVFCEKLVAKQFFDTLFKKLNLKGRILLLVPDYEEWRDKTNTKFQSNTLHSCDVIYGDKYITSDCNIPEWWVQNKAIESFIPLEYEMLESINLAKFASWIGYTNPKLNVNRSFEYKMHHMQAFHSIFPSHIITSEDWKISSYYKLIVIKRKDSLCGFQYKTDYKKI